MNPNPYQPPIPPPTPSSDPSLNRGNMGGYSSEERNWAMAAHLASFSAYVGVPLGHIVGPLIVWLIKKDEFPFVNECGKEAVNYGISMCIYLIISFVLAFVLIGFFMLAGLAIFDIIVTIMAAMAASKGEHYRYPAIIRFIT